MKTLKQIQRETNQTEIRQAKQSDLRHHTVDGHQFTIKMHAAARAFSRRPDLKTADWNKFLVTAHRQLKNKPVGKYLISSKKHDQAVAINKIDDQHSDVITVFVKGTHRLRSDTEHVLVEGLSRHSEDFFVYIEIA